jgi:ABC-2 type transport system ATP-binding protein
MPDAIVLRGLTKTFGDTVAVRDFDLVVPQGALYGVIGPNGAGKTTAIRMILSILLPDRGELSVLGHRSAMEAKDRIGYLPEERGLYKRMRVAQFLTYMARLKNADGADLRTRIRSWLEKVDLGGVEHKRCEELSKGMQQKVQFLWMPISRDPNSVLAVVLSFVPPISNFVIMLRLASSTPPPLWQTLLSIAVGAAGVYASLWLAARVFRIGLLMYGKPPNLATLVRWARTG